MFEYFKKGFGFTVGCILGIAAMHFCAKHLSVKSEDSEED